MSKGLLFWVIWVICVLIWAGVTFGGFGGPMVARASGGGVIDLVLFGLLGWQVFGAVVR